MDDLDAVIRDLRAHVAAVQRERRSTRNGRVLLDAINALPGLVKRLEAIAFQTDADFEELEGRLEALASRPGEPEGWVLVPRYLLADVLDDARGNNAATEGEFACCEADHAEFEAQLAKIKKLEALLSAAPKPESNLQKMQSGPDTIAQITRLRGEVERLRAAISWIIPPFVDADTPEAELRNRVQFVNDDLHALANMEREG